MNIFLIENQKYDGCIAEERFRQLKLDFDASNIRQRITFYRSIIEKIVAPDRVSSAYIAGGGFFIKYSEDSAASKQYPEEYKRLEQSSTMQLYIRYGDKYAQNWTISKNEFLTPAFQNVDISQDPDRVGSQILVEVENIKVRVVFTTDTIAEQLSSYTYEPCKIGYDYGRNIILLSRWFLVGGPMESAINEKNDDHVHLVRKYKFKNITDSLATFIKTDVFFNLNL